MMNIHTRKVSFMERVTFQANTKDKLELFTVGKLGKEDSKY